MVDLKSLGFQSKQMKLIIQVTLEKMNLHMFYVYYFNGKHIPTIFLFFSHKTITLPDHSFNINGGKAQKLRYSLILFLSEFSFAETDDACDSWGKDSTIFFHLYHFH